MSNLLILCDRNNLDRNSLHELAAAVADTGAEVIAVNEDRYLIEAAAPAHAASVISSMEGVCYVRSVFNYYCPPQAA